MKKLIIIFVILFLTVPAIAKVGLYGNPVPIVISSTRNDPVLIKLYDLDNTVYTEAEVQAITKIEIKYTPSSTADSESTDSVACSDCFNVTDFSSWGEISVDIANIAFTVGRDREAELIIYTASWPLGLVVGLLDIKIDDGAIRDATMINPLVTVISLDELSDVAITTPSDGETIFYNESTGNFENGAATGLGDVLATDLDTWAEFLALFGITGTPDGTKFLRDDGTWQTVSGGGSTDPDDLDGDAVDDDKVDVGIIPTGAVADSAATLSTGDQIYDFVIGLGYSVFTWDFDGDDITDDTIDDDALDFGSGTDQIDADDIPESATRFYDDDGVDAVDDADHDATNEIQLGDGLTITGAGTAGDPFVAVGDGYEANTDAQDLTLDGNTLAISGDPNTAVDLSGYLDNTATNITVVEAPTNVEIQSSDGTNDTIAAADETNAGVMTTTMYDEHVANNSKVTYDINGQTSKTTPVDADELGLYDSGGFKKLTWANLKATLKTYFDTLYAPAGVWKRTFTISDAENLPIDARAVQEIPGPVNGTGSTLTITSIKAWSDEDNYTFKLYETSAEYGFATASETLIDTVACSTDGTAVYSFAATTGFDDSSIADGNHISFRHSSGTCGWVSIEIEGTY